MDKLFSVTFLRCTMWHYGSEITLVFINMVVNSLKFTQYNMYSVHCTRPIHYIFFCHYKHYRPTRNVLIVLIIY